MPIYRDEGVVLRTHKLGEADRIVTLLTRRNGKVRAVAKGIRRTSSRFGSRLEPFMVADLQLYEGRSLDTITQAETLGAYGQHIVADYDSYTAANVIVETADKLTESDSNRNQYVLLLGALRSLSRHEHTPSQTLDSYLLRALSLAGWAPSFHDCSRCQAQGPHATVVVQMGGVVCTECAPSGSPRIAAEVREHLGALLAGQWDVVEASEERVRAQASGIVAAYVQWHLERGLRSFAHLSSSPEERQQ